MKSKLSCCTNGLICGVSVDKACYVFSAINLTVMVSCLIGCLFYIGWLWDVHSYPYRHRDMDGLEVYLHDIFCIIIALSSVVAFSFSVLLFYGVLKIIPSFLMMYWCYGIFVEVLSVAGAIAYVALGRNGSGVDENRVKLSSAALIACATYVFPLILVRRTYVLFVNATTNLPC